jgi:hypothetical protein
MPYWTEADSDKANTRADPENARLYLSGLPSISALDLKRMAQAKAAIGQ